jgi:hypothetical protein
MKSKSTAAKERHRRESIDLLCGERWTVSHRQLASFPPLSLSFIVEVEVEWLDKPVCEIWLTDSLVALIAVSMLLS